MLISWELSSSGDRRALDLVDGRGRWQGHGPHYSRRTPGSRTFTGVGQEIILVTSDGTAVWAVVRQRTPNFRGTGGSRGRSGNADPRPRFVWRNMLFRNLGSVLSSVLIRSATETTYREWSIRYGALPSEILRTEIDPKKIRSSNPGFSYLCAGLHNRRSVRGNRRSARVYLDAPCPTLMAGVSCACCPGSSLNVLEAAC